MPIPETEGQMIRTALGIAWCNLSEETQQRFETDPDKPVEYSGIMSEVYCSRIGRIMATMATLFGSPLVPYSGTNIPIDVRVFKKPNRPDIYKKRTYYFSDKPPFSVETRMSVDVRGDFIEYAGMGLGMLMKLDAHCGKLYFYGQRYVLDIGRVRIPIPQWLAPGAAKVEHTDYGIGKFRVRIEMRHPWFGVTFVQDGVFATKASA